MNEDYDVNVTLNGKPSVSGTIRLTRNNVSHCTYPVVRLNDNYYIERLKYNQKEEEEEE